MVRDVQNAKRPRSRSSEDGEDDQDEKARLRERKALATALSQTFGPIPGVEVGASWDTRESCALTGVHRVLMAGIHGSKKEGAYSIAVSCHYKDDKDLGDTIIYTGAGGRQRWTDGTSGKPPKRIRVGPQIYDQKWEDWGNEALVTSRDTGKPVRVIRSYKHVSKYAPEKGYRYDGLYTVEDAWKEKNSQGLDICRYKLVRIPGQPPIPIRKDPEGQTRQRRSKNASPPSVTTESPTATTSPSPADSSGGVMPSPEAHLTPLQRHKQRVMLEMQELNEYMAKSSSKRRL